MIRTRSYPFASLALAVLASVPAAAQVALPGAFSQLPEGFYESFALSSDRGAILDVLLPGTVEHYYFSCLHLQQQGELEAAQQFMLEWREAHRPGPGYKQIEARQALLSASTDPAATYRFIERDLELLFDEKRSVRGASPDLPTTLDISKISTEALLTQALRSDSLDGLNLTTLESIVTRKLTSVQQRQLLDLLPRPNVPGLIELVIEELAELKGNTFGNRKIHRKLTLAQLEQLRGARPELLANEVYIETVMQRLAPRFPEDIKDRADRLAYLQRVYAFVSLLPSSQVSLKAHLLYHWIAWDLDGGSVNEERLMAYLRLPRQSRYCVQSETGSKELASLQLAFEKETPFSKIGSEEAVISDCLMHVFRTTKQYDRFVGVLDEAFVKRTFAEARLLYGEAEEAETYVRMLGVDRAEKLRGRVDIQFARTNPKHLSADEPVTLEVDVKNVDRMLVKVFEIDPVAYFDRFGRSVSSHLDLDGLAANDAQVLEFDTRPMARVRREIALEALTKPGTYIVELIGGGISSRAVIIKGSLRLLQRPTAAGHSLLVLNEAGQPAPDAIVRFGGRDFTAGEDGRIHVPYSPTASTKRVLLRSRDIASIASFQHEGEAYQLEAAIHTPLEGLLAGMQATVVARPSLRLNRRIIPLSLLDEASLQISAETHDGATSQSIISGLTFDSSGDVVQQISVPERVSSITVTFSGTIRSMTEAKEVRLKSKPKRFSVHARHREAPFQSYLTKNLDGYALDVLGRGGEPLPDTEVQVQLLNRKVGKKATVRLKTDSNGRVQLGELRDTSTLRLISPASMTNSWSLDRRPVARLSRELHGRVGEALRVPCDFLSQRLTRADASLLSVGSQGQFVEDHFDSLSTANGYVVLEGLPEGQYQLVLKRSSETLRVTILEGEAAYRHLVSKGHSIPAADSAPLQIESVEDDGEGLTIQLGGMSPSARVHVIATRYLEPLSMQSNLRLQAGVDPALVTFMGQQSTYESSRQISPEYRYILDRRLLETYPGNMLTRPGYLLNPWALQGTSGEMSSSSGIGESSTDSAFGLGGGAGGKYGGRFGGRGSSGPTFAAPDFLERGAVFLTNLRPDDTGLVRIPAEDLGSKHMVQIVAMDDVHTVEARHVRKESAPDLRERRMVDALDPALPMTRQRRIEFLAAGESYVIRDAPHAGARTFASLSEVFELYRTTGQGGADLASFEFMTRWPSLTEEEKRAKYSEFACHELHVFLRRRDPEFFQSVVVPHLSSKGHATFMDDWLLGRDLTEYLEPWRFEELNIVELILLLRETGGDPGAIAQDQLGLLPANAWSLDAVFADVLASRGLDSSRSSLGRALKDARQRRGAGGGGGGGLDPSSMGGSRSSGREDASALARLGAAVEAPEEVEEEVIEEFEVESSLRELRKNAEGFFFRDLAVTVEQAETHYWQSGLAQMNARFVTVSPFWVDFANAGSEPFASTSFPLASRSVNEKLLALALLDLPFESSEPDAVADGRSVTLTAASPTLLALEDIAPATLEEGSPTLLVGQDFFSPARPTEWVDGMPRDVLVTDEFQRGVPYGCRMIVTNPSPSKIDMQLLVQIPEGAIALGDSSMTDSVSMTLDSYGTRSLETFFYFPKSGSYRHYPVHAGRGNTLLGAAKATGMDVVDELSVVDESTWEWVSQNADLPQLLDYLKGSNVRKIDMAQIAWRMNELPAFIALTDALGARGVYPDVLWKYAIKHQDALRTQRFLEGNEALVARVGSPFRSPLLRLDSRVRRAYEHLAYEPLVNGRAHHFAPDDRILNDQFKTQYRRFLATLALDTERDAEETVELVYYLFLQERIFEALAAYDTIDEVTLRTRVQYDYMTAYVAFYRNDVPAARAVANGYVDYPVDLWRSRFRNVLSQADEIEGLRGRRPDPDDRDQSQGSLASLEPLLSVEIDGGEILVAAEGMDDVELRFHRMDVEFLFSSSPFVRGDQGVFGVIQPSRVVRVPVPPSESLLKVALPDDLRSANMVVEVRGGGIARQTTYFAGELAVQGIERYGQVRALRSQGGAPLAKAYVKVYARLKNGAVRFHKDGYTDLRGRFDYVSLSGESGPAVARYSLLVMHDEAGATMLELAPPAR